MHSLPFLFLFVLSVLTSGIFALPNEMTAIDVPYRRAESSHVPNEQIHHGAKAYPDEKQVTPSPSREQIHEAHGSQHAPKNMSSGGGGSAYKPAGAPMVAAARGGAGGDTEPKMWNSEKAAGKTHAPHETRDEQDERFRGVNYTNDYPEQKKDQ